jgi:hypothetical protein
MTFAVTTSWQQVTPSMGAGSVIIGNPSGGQPIQITQRIPVNGATEEATPDTDPGFIVAADSAIILPFGQGFWIKGGGAQNVSITPFA